MWVNLESGRRVEITTVRERPDLIRANIDVGPWPTFMRHNRVAEAFFWQIPQVFPELCLVGTDERGTVVADAQAIRFLDRGELPSGGWETTVVQAFGDQRRGVKTDTVIDDGRENPTRYRLFTTLTDPVEVTATDLAATYTQRWEIELAFDELKTHQRGPRTVLRSKSPDLVLQEIWGHLCCHYAIRSLMNEAATHSGHDPDRVSFVAALRIIRQTLAHPGAFSP